MNIPNTYEGLQVEPPRVAMVEQVHLRGKVLSESQFVFIPEYWEEQLKPYKKAQWKYFSNKREMSFPQSNLPNEMYQIKSGVFLVFPEFESSGGFYAAHLYSIVKEMKEGQVYGTFTKEGLLLERKVEGRTVQRVELKPRTMQSGDTPYHAILSY